MVRHFLDDVDRRRRRDDRLSTNEGHPGGHPSFVFVASVEVIAQYLGAARVTQLRHRLGLDLADALARDAVDLADLVEGLG